MKHSSIRLVDVTNRGKHTTIEQSPALSWFLENGKIELLFLYIVGVIVEAF